MSGSERCTRTGRTMRQSFAIIVSSVLLVGNAASAFAANQDRPRRIIGGDYIVRDASDRPVVNDRPRGATTSPLLIVTPPTSPGEWIAQTAWDSQHNDSQGHQIARNPGEDFVHMVWTHWDVIPESIGDRDRFVNYASWNVLGPPGFELYPGFDGVSIGLGDFARAGFVRMDIDSDNLAHTVFHQYPDPGIANYSAWHVFLPLEGGDVILLEQLPSIPNNPEVTETLWPDIAITQNHGAAKDVSTDVVHAIASVASCFQFCGVFDEIAYWRFDNNNPGWSQPVLIDSTNGPLSYVIDALDGTDRVAVAFTQNYESQWNNLQNIVYRESTTGGLGWVNGAELGDANREYITNYTDNLTPGPQAWAHISIAYDHAAVLHLVWDEQRYADDESQAAIRHWDDVRRTIDEVETGYYENFFNYPGHLNLNKITLGVGDGAAFCSDYGITNENFLYVTYTKNCGETAEEAADVSDFGFCNGELYITGSASDGQTWSKPINLTNTKTPGCRSANPDSLCASDVMATIARDISGQEGIDILYLVDREAATWADGGGWTLNPVMYLNLPGGDNAAYVCPLFAPSLELTFEQDPECEFHTMSGMQVIAPLGIENGGTAPLSGSIIVTQGGAWLSTVPSGAYNLGASDPTLSVDVTMDASSLPNGYYAGEIQITHNDTLIADPLVIPIDFFVTDDFFCPQAMVLKTAKTNPWVLGLSVANNGRFGAGDLPGRLLRLKDSSYSIGDASLVIAHGTQSTDTVAFHRFGDNFTDPGQFGFIPILPLSMDTSAYGTGAGFASATALFHTRDSLIEITTTWYAPQHPDSADFVIAEYVVRNRTVDLPGGHPQFNQALSDVLVGLWNDLDVVESNKQNVQHDADNSGSDALVDSNFVYQYGFDTVGHSGFATSRKFSGGITYMKGRDANGTSFSFSGPAGIHAGVGLNTVNKTPFGGPSSGALYSTLTGGPGVVIDPNWVVADSSEDMFTYFQLDHDLTLAPGASQNYVIGFVSDTLSHPDYVPSGQEGAITSLHQSLQKAWRWGNEHLGCHCPTHGDPVSDGLVNVFDVVAAVDVAFRSGPPNQSVRCPFADTDVTCDGTTNVFDVVAFVDVAFRAADAATAFCNPCN